MAQKHTGLSPKERVAQDAFVAKLVIKKRKTREPTAVALVGLVGSGKSSVARELARHTGATVIAGDAVRVELRERGVGYGHVRAIVEHAATEVLKCGGNVVLDSDFIDVQKRADIRKAVRKLNANLVFACTYCDFDVAVGRALAATYRDRAGNFFGSASSTWKGSEQIKGAVVKIREMWRRTPLHYRWVSRGGGRWIIKNPPVSVLADIDTTDGTAWKRAVAECAKKLL